MKLLPLVFLLIAVLLSLPNAVEADRLTPKAGRAGRSVVMAPHGMVATSHPLAAQIGLDVLKQGGNAVDAAIAANAALGLMEPMSCGIGGDLYALVWDAKTKKLYGLNASGRSPYKATREFFAEQGLDEIPDTGPLSWSVPGCVDGWDELRKRFGTMPLGRTARAEHPLCRGGLPGHRSHRRLLARRRDDSWRQYPDAARTYLIDGQAPARRRRVQEPGPGAAPIARSPTSGRDAFYKGRIARDIVAFSEKNGGLFA